VGSQSLKDRSEPEILAVSRSASELGRNVTSCYLELVCRDSEGRQEGAGVNALDVPGTAGGGA
jgi:hypothetical protein